MGSSISNETKSNKYSIKDETILETNNNIIVETDKKSDVNLEKNFVDINSIELKRYNYLNENHKPPFPDEYYSEYVIPKEYICEKTNKPFYIFMGEIVGSRGKNLIDITESYNMCYIWHDRTKDIIQIWGNKDKHKIIHDYIFNMIDSKLNYEKNICNKNKILKNLNKILIKRRKKVVFDLLKKK
tara:strand:+ start:167 stop:721 length:555 start_codon:yes stop_codon:yes gene_type:complete